MARTKKEKEEINNEQILETQAPETTETPVVDEGQPIIPEDFVNPEAAKDEENTDAEGGEAKETPEDTEGNTENPEGEGEETEKAPEGENEVNTQNPEGEDKGEEVIAKAQTILEGDERIEEALKGNDPEAAAELLKGELEKANEVKAQLEDDIVKREEEIKKKPVNKKKFQHMFGGFWNGVTSGWED